MAERLAVNQDAGGSSPLTPARSLPSAGTPEAGSCRCNPYLGIQPYREVGKLAKPSHFECEVLGVRCPPSLSHTPVAQRVEAAGSRSAGWKFKSSQDYQARVTQLVEVPDLKSGQCQFKSDREYQLSGCKPLVGGLLWEQEAVASRPLRGGPRSSRPDVPL